MRVCGVGGGLTIEEYIAIYFLLYTENIGSQVPVNSIQNLGLKVILLALDKIAGLTYLHQDSIPLMFYVVECMRTNIYVWSTSLLGNMKQQLSEYKLGKMRNFGFSSILSTFLFEHVLGLIPRVEINPHGPRDPAQLC